MIRAARAVAGEPSKDILLKNSLIAGVAVEGVLSDSTRHMSGCTLTGQLSFCLDSRPNYQNVRAAGKLCKAYASFTAVRR